MHDLGEARLKLFLVACFQTGRHTYFQPRMSGHPVHFTVFLNVQHIFLFCTNCRTLSKTIKYKSVFKRVFLYLPGLFVVCTAAARTGGNTVPKVAPSDNDSVKIGTFTRSIRFLINHNTDSASSVCNGALQYFTTGRNTRGQAAMLRLSAQIDLREGRTAAAIIKLQDVLNKYRFANERGGVGHTCLELGEIEEQLGNKTLASDLYENARAIFESTKNGRGHAAALLHQGQIFATSDSLGSAMLCYTKAGELLASDTGNALHITLLYDLARLYAGRKEYTKSLATYESALQGSSGPEMEELHAAALIESGLLLGNLHNEGAALERLRRALQFSRNTANHPLEARALDAIGQVYLDFYNSDAIYYFVKASGLARTYGLPALQTDILKHMVDYSRLEGDYNQALEVNDRRQRLLDSISGVEKATEIVGLQEAWDLQKSRAKVKQLTLLIQKNTFKRRVILFATVGNLVILIILAFSYRKSIRLNRQLVRRSKELTDANEIKDKMFSIIGHDLRGPIGNIPVLLDLSTDDSSTPEEKQYFENSIRELATSCKDTLDKLLYWGKSNIRGSKLKQEEFATREHIASCLRLIRSAADQKSITLADVTPANLRIFADTEHFEFVVRNLLANAVKFTFNGGRVEVASDSGMIKGFTVFMVRDTGKGIEPAKIPTLFEALNKSTEGTAFEKGTNIGLKLCRDFVSENGGRIWVESELGKGTTFYFSFRNIS